MRDLRNRVAVVTGAASGIGRALAHELAAAGCVLAISDVDETGLAETHAAVAARGARVASARLDVADRAAVHAYADRVVAELGSADVVVNNAGVALSCTIEHMAYEDFEWLMGINFWGVVHGTKAFLPHMRRAGRGHIVNVSSVFGIIGVPTQAAYNAAKFAVRGFTESLRAELELDPCGVSCTCVHPGGIRTNITRNQRMGAMGPLARPREQMEREFDQVARTTSETAARAIVEGIRRNKRRVLIGVDARLIDVMQRLLPTSYQRIVVSQAKRRQRG